ncbi:MAG: Uncharacterised protein [SAR116 cluster bacterium]|nr:MAG: Uncharacterised protein [SAR116 cluster bacterium]
MDIFVQITLFFEKEAQFSAAPNGPVMAVDQDFSLLSKQGQRVINAARPKQGVTDLRATWWHEIMHGLCTDLGHTECSVVGHEECKFCRRFSATRHHEDKPHPINDPFGTGLCNECAGRNKCTLAFRHCFADSPIHKPFRASRQRNSELIDGTS